MADNTKDIDFDELHQAVNALMDEAQKGKKPATPADESRPPVDVPERPKAEPKPQQQDHHIAVTVKRPLPTLTTHRGPRGRAMDVVGPRPKAPARPPSERPKREAPTLHPTGDVKPEAPEHPIVHDTPPPLADSATPAKEPTDDVLASIDMKDEPTHHTMTHQKAEVHGFKDDDAPKAEEPKEHQAVDKPDAAAPTLEPDKQAEPEAAHAAPDHAEESATPFVTTKVEKRPLGAYADSDQPPAEAAPAADKDKHVEDKAAPSPLPQQPQPAELSPEVVAVESGMSEPLMATEETEAPGVDGLRNMAIPHQYKEADKAADAHARPVFDTKEYHPAIETHVGGHHKQSSVGTWIMAISLVALLIIALGFIYYMINGSLDPSLLFS